MQIRNVLNVGTDGYNAYAVLGERCALIGGVPKEYSDKLISNISEAGIDKIDYVVFNHASPFQAGSLEAVLSKYPDAVVTGTVAAIKNIKEFVFTKFGEQVAKNGGSVDLGGRTLEFYITPNVPWPDTMLTYVKEDKILFSGEMFSAKDNSFEKFYDDVLRQNSGFAEKCIEKIKSLEAEKVCPSYGEELEDISALVALYEKKIRENSRENFVALCYMSRFGYTREMAEITADTLEKSGISVEMIDVEKNGAETCNAINRARAVIFASPTINRNAPPEIWSAVCGLDAVLQRGIPCMTMGDCGWSGDAPVLIHTHLKAMNFKMFEKPFLSVFRMTEEEKEKLKKYAERFAAFITACGDV